MRLLVLTLVLTLPAPALADAFDNYTNEILVKAPDAKTVQKVKELTPEVMVEHSRALPGITGTFIVIKTNDGKMAKLLVQPARQKLSATESVPILLIERFVAALDEWQ